MNDEQDNKPGGDHCRTIIVATDVITCTMQGVTENLAEVRRRIGELSPADFAAVFSQESLTLFVSLAQMGVAATELHEAAKQLGVLVWDRANGHASN